MPVMRAGAMMLAKGIHRMPVISEGKLVGIVTRSRIYRHVFRDKFH
jgi:CBS domain-containing protein